MILNSGLDTACTTVMAQNFIPNTSTTPFNEWVQYACFGTGSSTPDPTDIALDAQVGARTNDRGGFDNTEGFGLDDGLDIMWYEVTFIRVFNIGSNVNATEWGLAATSGGNLSVRDLFRADPNDPMSSPITLTLESGDQLQLVVTVRVQADWEYASKSFVISGAPGHDANGTYDGNAALTPGAGSSITAVRMTLRAAWPGGSDTGASRGAYVTARMSDQSTQAKDQDLTGSQVAATTVAETYTPGDYYRDYTCTWSTGQANAAIYGFDTINAASGSGHVGRGFRFLFTNPATLVKTSSHRLSITLRKRIARL